MVELNLTLDTFELVAIADTAWHDVSGDALQHVATTSVDRLFDLLALGAEWSLDWVTWSVNTLVLAWTATLITRNDTGYLFTLALTALKGFGGWTLISLVLGRAGKTWQALIGWATSLGSLAWESLLEVLVLSANWFANNAAVNTLDLGNALALMFAILKASNSSTSTL